MKKEDLIKLKEKISELLEHEKKLRDLYLRDISIGKIYGPMTGYASIDKPWLKYYDEKDIDKVKPRKTIYRYAVDNNADNLSLNAIKFLGFKINFRDFFRNVDRVANSFVALGVKEGDIVSICSPTFPETIYANFALNKIGAIANNIDPRNNASRIVSSVNNANSEYLIMLDIVYPKINNVVSSLNVKKIICNSYLDSIPTLLKPMYKCLLSQKLSKKGLKFPKIDFGNKYISWNQFLNVGKMTVAKEVEYKDDMVAAMVLTGGTTGFPKSVSLTNDTALSLVESYLATDLGLEKGQSLLNIMPEFIAYGWTFGVVMATCLGIENIIISQFELEEFPDYIKKNKPNHIVGVPTHCDYLVRDKRMDNVDFSKFLKSISVGGDSYIEENEKRFIEFLYKHNFFGKVITGYGMTEGNSSMATRLNKCNVPGSVGVPLVKNTIAIFSNKYEDDKFKDEELMYNEEGEVCIFGPSIMKEYYLNDEETKKSLIPHSDGTVWLHSKDTGYMTSDGILFVKGRDKRMIIRPDGHNVWPSEMEKVICMHKDVSTCSVFGIPSDSNLQGEYPHAVVVLKDNNINNYNLEQIESEIRKLCLDNLPERDVPYTYSFRDDLLYTNIGKVDVDSMKNEVLNNKPKVRIKKR